MSTQRATTRQEVLEALEVERFGSTVPEYRTSTTAPAADTLTAIVERRRALAAAADEHHTLPVGRPFAVVHELNQEVA